MLAWSEQLQRRILGETLLEWISAIATFFVVYVAVVLTKSLLRRRLERPADAAELPQAAASRRAAVKKLVAVTGYWFTIILALYAAVLVLDPPQRVAQVARSVATIAVFVQAALWAGVLLRHSIESHSRRRLEVDPAGATTLSILGFLAQVVLWLIVAVLTLDNVGVNVTALVAGLGIGGVAVAFAAQNLLRDLLGSLSIALDKPFSLGDFIIVDDKMGTVEYVGLRTTRIRSLSGEQLIMSNDDLLQSRIANYKRMHERRVVFNFQIAYGTPRERIAEVPAMVRQIVEGQRPTRFDRSHFKEFASSGLVFETVYFVLSPNYNQYMDIQQNINLNIFAEFEKAEINFAFPTSTVMVRPAPANITPDTGSSAEPAT